MSTTGAARNPKEESEVAEIQSLRSQLKRLTKERLISGAIALFAKNGFRATSVGDIAKAAGTTHPAVFLLFPPPPTEFKAAALSHESEKNLWFLDVNATGKSKDKSAPVPLQIVVIGKAEG